jgi:hypothetical protein
MSEFPELMGLKPSPGRKVHDLHDWARLENGVRASALHDPISLRAKAVIGQTDFARLCTIDFG